MTNSTAQTRPRGCLFWLGLGVGGVVVLYLFREELGFLREGWGALVKLMNGEQAQALAPGSKMLPALTYLGANLVGAVLFGLMLVVLLSQVILPVPTGMGRLQLVRRITAYLGGFRPRVVFVKEGKLVKPLENPGQLRSGMVIVDLNSAIVLEKQWMTMALDVPGMGRGGAQRFPGRVGGPGVVFVGFNERLRGTVSLRKQFRINLNVRAYTSDGIEVECHVFSIFSLGQTPSVQKLAYVGEMIPENLRVIYLDEGTKKIKSIANELDEDDRIEVHQYAQGFITSNEMPASLEPLDKGEEYPPFAVDENRILSAIYSQGRRVGQAEMDTWSDLPALVATEVFRNHLSQVAYDDIYLPKDPDRFPLQQEIKPRFVRAVKSLGVKSYQFMHRMDGQPIEVGQRVDFRLFRVSPVQPFRTPKILRDRGIKIIHAGFTELRPSDPLIRQQRLENWRSHWQTQQEAARADQEREVMRILSKARAEKQREMITSLSNILKSSAYSEEALVLRVFQALEDVTTDPTSKRILPRDTINLLRNLRIWLLPDSKVAANLLPENYLPEDGEVEDER